MDMIAHNQYLQQNINYMKDIYRRKYERDSYYYDSPPDLQAHFDRINGNDYISIRIGERLFLNEDFDRHTRTSTIRLGYARLYGNSNYDYEDYYEDKEEINIPEIITPEDLIKGMQEQTKDLSSLSVEELQKILSKNNERISSYDEEIKQALIQKILEQQQTIIKQQEEISRLKSQIVDRTDGE